MHGYRPLLLASTGTWLLHLLSAGADGNDPHVLKVRRAVVLAGSQKTLPVAVVVIGKLAEQLGISPGIAVLSCILSHLTQNLFDSGVVSHWLRQDKLAGRLVGKK